MLGAGPVWAAVLSLITVSDRMHGRSCYEMLSHMSISAATTVSEPMQMPDSVRAAPLHAPGKGLQHLALPAPPAMAAITQHPHASPIHRLRSTGALLPTSLVSPAQAERDHQLRDMYTYMTIQVHQPPIQLLHQAFPASRWSNSTPQEGHHIRILHPSCEGTPAGYR
jgi:hypothetical protein